MTRQRPMLITTFGYDGEPPPVGCLVIDTRPLFANPREDTVSATWNGLHQGMIGRVLGQPGADRFAVDLAHLLSGLGITHDDVAIAIGCADGQAVSVVLANRVAERLKTHGYRPAKVVHRDLHEN